MTTALFTAITVYTLAKSQRLANFLDAVTNERMSLRAKSAALLDIWRRKR